MPAFWKVAFPTNRSFGVHSGTQAVELWIRYPASLLRLKSDCAQSDINHNLNKSIDKSIYRCLSKTRLLQRAHFSKVFLAADKILEILLRNYPPGEGPVAMLRCHSRFAGGTPDCLARLDLQILSPVFWQV